jgi:hypothetical protein
MARCLFEMFDKLEAKSNAKASNNSKWFVDVILFKKIWFMSNVKNIRIPTDSTRERNIHHQKEHSINPYQYAVAFRLVHLFKLNKLRQKYCTIYS